MAALKKVILIVEDNEINRELLVTILSNQYIVLEAENGLEALKVLQSSEKDVDLIITDIIMPVIDGYAFLDHLKEDEELSRIPVIATTQNDSEEDEVEALKHGATDFVPKPYRPKIILHRVANLISFRETTSMINHFRYDRLTGLYTKEFFYKKVHEILTINPDKQYTIICSNVENFKLYNDVLGSTAGDKLLQEITSMLKGLTVNGEICGRLTADHFMLLKERPDDNGDYEYLVKAGQEIISKVKNAVIKWGIYEINDRSVPVEQMCDRALLATLSIKGQYNVHYSIYDDKLRSKLLREQIISDSMVTALKEKQFKVYLQPKYSLYDDRLAGAEALVRWIHPELGFLSPGEFIPLFEKNGFISQLDRYVCEQVCALLHEWTVKGSKIIPVSVNISRADIFQEDLIDTLLFLTHKYEIDPYLLHLEVTESAYTDHTEQIIKTMDKLRELGFIIEMDDFGSGASSLNMLNQMSLDILKLDMKFIQNETAKSLDKGILQFVMKLARWKNLSVVAEGVETQDQLEYLRKVGCDYVQGYLLAKPMPIPDFEKLLKLPLSQAPEKYAEPVTLEKVLMVVDEDPEYRQKVKEAFYKEYQVLVPSSVDEALENIIHHEYSANFAVILSMTLPNEGAIKVMRYIQANPTLWNIPVLVTIKDDLALEEQALMLNASDFIKKPHTMAGLKKRISQLTSISAHLIQDLILEQEANQDYLTGLLNRRGLHAAVESLRQEDLPIALYLFDLDDLKKINDRYGHNTGDELLIAFANLLKSKTRSDDILCRYGGDEFIIILRRIRDKEIIEKKGEEICRGVMDICPKGNIHPSCSAGAVLCKIDERPTIAMISKADKALYQAKKMGKGTCVLLQEE